MSADSLIAWLLIFHCTWWVSWLSLPGCWYSIVHDESADSLITWLLIFHCTWRVSWLSLSGCWYYIVHDESADSLITWLLIFHCTWWVSWLPLPGCWYSIVPDESADSHYLAADIPLYLMLSVESSQIVCCLQPFSFPIETTFEEMRDKCLHHAINCDSHPLLQIKTCPRCDL